MLQIGYINRLFFQLRPAEAGFEKLVRNVAVLLANLHVNMIALCMYHAGLRMRLRSCGN